MAHERKRLWIDSHTHLFGHLLDGGPLEYGVDDILKVLDGSDADLRFIVNDNGTADVMRFAAEPDSLHEMNENLYRRFVKPLGGRLFGSVQVDPRALRQSHEDLDLYVGERGYVMVGEVEGIPHGFDLDCPGMLELVRHAAKLGAPVQLHCSTNDSPTGEHIRQALHVARAVPEAKIVIAHAIGGRNTYQYILAAETHLAHVADNLTLEITSFNVRSFLRAAYEHLGPDRLMVGTDWATYHAPPFDPYATHITLQARRPGWWRDLPLQGVSRWDSLIWLSAAMVLDLDETPYPVAVESFVGFLREAGVTGPDTEKIGSGTAARLFGLGEKGLISKSG
jgi:predicted TIM-barrel fold metal-dependent hydrolase